MNQCENLPIADVQGSPDTRQIDQYGTLLIGKNGPPATVQEFEMDWMHIGDSLYAMLQWTLALGLPLGVGLAALALTLAAVGYFAVQVAWRVQVTLAWRARRRRRHRHHTQR